MHILILTPGFPTSSLNGRMGSFYGGSFVLTEVLAYHSGGARVTVLTPHVPGLPIKEILSQGLEVVRFRYFFPTKWQKVRIPKLPLYTTTLLWWRIFQLPFFFICFFLAIHRFIKEVDIIHANWTPTALLALPYKFIFGIPIVVTYRGSDVKKLPTAMNRFIFRNVDGVLDIWDGQGKAAQKTRMLSARYIKLPLISKTPSRKSEQVIDKGEKRPGSAQFVFMGRLVIQEGILKGTDVIIPAVEELSQHYDNFEVHVLGDGPSKDYMEKQCRQLAVNDHVRMHGYQQDVFPFLARCDALIGGVGLNAVAQEGAYCRTLLIMPDAPGWESNLWIHKKNALLYEPGNARSLAEAMAYVIECGEHCKEIALNGHKTITKYVVDMEEGGKLYVDAFQEIIKNATGRHP